MFDLDLLMQSFVQFIEQLPFVIFKYVNTWYEEHFYSGYRPLFLISEHTVNPRGFWLSYKLPVSYYSSNTVFYHWPVDLNFWINLFRQSIFIGYSSALSYKELTRLLLEQTPYWCEFSLWDSFSNLLNANYIISATFNVAQNIILFEGSLFEVRFLSQPYFYDFEWEEWVLKIDYALKDGLDRYGVSPGQIQRRIFLQWFWIGYWAYFLFEIPWPWRILYPKDKSNVRWFKYQFMSYFKLFNPLNSLFFFITAYLIYAIYWSSTWSKEALWFTPYREMLLVGFSSWSCFFTLSLVFYFPLARFASILYAYTKKVAQKGSVLKCMSSFFSRGSPLWKKRFFIFFIGIWHIVAFSLLIFWFYAFTPYWGLLLSFLIKVIQLPIMGVYYLMEFLIIEPVFVWFLPKVFSTLEVPFWSEIIYFCLESIRMLVRHFTLFYYYLCFFFGYFLFILWPFIYPVVKNQMAGKYPKGVTSGTSLKFKITYYSLLARQEFEKRTKN